ncbi:MAG: penicillin-binding protein 2 [Zymomonas mobilis subsp. pomaceae]|uniref:Penicillin-binding protein 2 n=1 Tax=Zymomonas mobilis subsp. pomaceae (strain ATCC 29192 / DSM 22645 / JCM 10191 / CCUG 17912 / NBRC 13757 / NCIMB 11200 / NRRL B-4491 / Barker I) TaxID=579138 RepID=F8ESG4_ZYMMT|nr:penicillin-binding protein 2 [Zymomonas mobilis]AEI37739.1 penicillin-binding protein 2 [Zymomonas mobilis subsp. pomaceae ATCC 29192]MDX5949106.1 penicillin-binding protein 2 [Zymomonas mobilis subsp. pomaceae]GEB88913.1 peptidoglycan glycosyltransferase [Zymomonas mobilis subsp. pomaceae]
MKNRSRLITQHSLGYTFSRRSLVLGGLQLATGGLLAARMAWLSIAENERYRLMAEDNRVQTVMIPPRRGWIVDRHNRPMAINHTDFRVDLIPDQIQDRERVIITLTELLNLSQDDLDRIREDLNKAAGYQPVPVAEHLDYEHFAAISVRLPEMAGVAPQRGYARYYPEGAAVGHLIGYVGSATTEDYKKTHDPLLITPGFKLGKQGLEKTFDDYLRGVPGARRSEVTAKGRLVRDLENKPDQPGKKLPLTIDAGLQSYAARRIGDNSAAVVVIDTENGDILAQVSMPCFDPNDFADGISHREWQSLSEDDHHPLIDKTVAGLYPPGSTVKPMNALALLEAGVDPHETVNCTGSYQLGNSVFHCWRRHGHGPVNMHTAITQSCDVYFYHMAHRVGMDPLADMMRRLGLGASYHLPLGSEHYGTVPDPAWKLKKYHHNWTAADTLNASIGQGDVLVNPLQLAVMVARLASGKQIMPRLIMSSKPPIITGLGINEAHLDIIRQAMRDVVNGGGTGGAAKLFVPNVELAGKTGTAQVRRISMAERDRGVLKNSQLAWRMRDHALFVCFAPVGNPRYAASVVIEHGGHTDSATDGPAIARDVLTYLFDPDRAMATLNALETSWGGDLATRMRIRAEALHASSSKPAETPEKS